MGSAPGVPSSAKPGYAFETVDMGFGRGYETSLETICPGEFAIMLGTSNGSQPASPESAMCESAAGPMIGLEEISPAARERAEGTGRGGAGGREARRPSSAVHR